MVCDVAAAPKVRPAATAPKVRSASVTRTQSCGVAPAAPAAVTGITTWRPGGAVRRTTTSVGWANGSASSGTGPSSAGPLTAPNDTVTGTGSADGVPLVAASIPLPALLTARTSRL